MSAIISRFLIIKDTTFDAEKAMSIVVFFYNRPHAKRFDYICVKASAITEEAYDILNQEHIPIEFL